MKNIVIVTPCSRLENIKTFRTDSWLTLIRKYVRTWYIVYDASKINSKNVPLFTSNVEDGVLELVYEGKGISGNPQRNVALDIISLQADQSGYVYFLDDDNTIQEELWELFATLNTLETSPQIHTWDMFYPTRRTVLLGNNPTTRNIDTSMFIVPLRIACTLRWNPDEYAADGIYIEALVKQHPDQWTYINRTLSVYNALTLSVVNPGRVIRSLRVAVLISGRSRCFGDAILPNAQKIFGVHTVRFFMSLNEDEHEVDPILQCSSFVKTVSCGPVVTQEMVKKYDGCASYPETNRRNTLSMFLHNKKAFDLIANDGQYDIVVKFRADILSEQPLPLFIATCDDTPCLWIPHGNDWRGGVNDQVAFGTYDIMKEYCSVVDCIDGYAFGTDELPAVAFHPEVILATHLQRRGVNVQRFEWQSSLSDRRHDEPLKKSTDAVELTIEELQSTGDWDAVLRRLESDPESFQNKMHTARALFESGDVVKAIVVYEDLMRIISVATVSSDESRTVYIQSAYAYLVSGMVHRVIEVCKYALSVLFQNDTHFAYLLGVAHMDIGRFSDAKRIFKSILSVESAHRAWYKHQICKVLEQHNGDADFSADIFFSHSFKVAEAEGSLDISLGMKVGVLLMNTRNMMLRSLPKNDALDAENQCALRHAADALGNLFILDCKGFPTNKRLCRAMGLAVIDAINRANAGSVSFSGDWKEFMSLFVRWRQAASRHDSVWWIKHDRPAEVSALRTPMFLTRRPVFRYRSYITRALASIKEKALSSAELENAHQRLLELSHLTPCGILDAFQCNVTALQVINGVPGVTFTLSKTQEGVDMHVCGVQNDQRTDMYERILDELFRRIPTDEDALYKFAYYWFNFQRLTRGTAVCGLAFVVACVVLTQHFTPSSLAPLGVQWDWESFVDTDELKVADSMRLWVTKDRSQNVAMPFMRPHLCISDMCLLLDEV